MFYVSSKERPHTPITKDGDACVACSDGFPQPCGCCGGSIHREEQEQRCDHCGINREMIEALKAGYELQTITAADVGVLKPE